eukprot:1114002-Rhodomonas_salina.1
MLLLGRGGGRVRSADGRLRDPPTRLLCPVRYWHSKQSAIRLRFCCPVLRSRVVVCCPPTDVRYRHSVCCYACARVCCYGMSGTDVAYGATSWCAGEGREGGRRCGIPRIALRVGYAVPGTDVAYCARRALCDVRY